MKQLTIFLLAFFLLAAESVHSQTPVDTFYISPNPFDSVTTIHFYIANNDTATLCVYNMLGQTVKTFFSNTFLPSGSYSIHFFRNTLSDGVYLMALKYGTNKQQTRKIVIRSLASGTSQSILNIDSLNVSPNQIDTTAIIHFDIANNDTVTLSISNLLGDTVQTFFSNTLLPSGSYSINFSRDTLSGGIYFVNLQYGTNKQKNQKVIIRNLLTSGIFQPILPNDRILFPNPFSDLLTIPINGNKTIIITNMKGQFCKTIKTEMETISLADLPIGNYLVSIFNQDNELLTTQQIIKER